MIYFKEDYVTICYEEKLNLLEVIWNGHIFSEHFRETLKMIIDLIEEKKIENFLVDRKTMQRISLADEIWRQENWFPHFLKSGIKRSASVISKDYYNEVSVARLIEEKDEEIKIERKSFYTYREAKAWLLKSALIDKQKK